MEWFDEAVLPYAEIAGLPVDQFKFVAFILLSYPLGFLHLRYEMRLIDSWMTLLMLIRLSSSILFRHIYSTVIGFAFLVFSFGWVGIFHFLVSSFLVYILVLLLGHSKAPTIGFVVMMGYLSYLHISRLFFDYLGWRMDVTCMLILTSLRTKCATILYLSPFIFFRSIYL